jgi:hypothetical protein
MTDLILFDHQELVRRADLTPPGAIRGAFAFAYECASTG